MYTYSAVQASEVFGVVTNPLSMVWCYFRNLFSFKGFVSWILMKLEYEFLLLLSIIASFLFESSFLI